jgi:hypothetical protein
MVACSECTKIITKFINNCLDQEINAVQISTLRAFCEAGKNEVNPHNINPDLCLVLNSKLASVAGEPGTELVDPTKSPGLCTKYRSRNI